MAAKAGHRAFRLVVHGRWEDDVADASPEVATERWMDQTEAVIVLA